MDVGALTFARSGLVACAAWFLCGLPPRVTPIAIEAATGDAQTVTASSLQRYATGDFDAAAAQLIGRRTVTALSREFRRYAERWIEEVPVADRSRRVAVAAAMAVEVMAASFSQDRSQYQEARVILEWACSRLRRQTPSEVERLFHLSSIALLQGARDESLLSGVNMNGAPPPLPTGSHVLHAGQRFPAESRFKLAYLTARVETQLLATWPLPSAYLVDEGYGRFNIDRPRASEELDDTLRLLSSLTTDPTVGPEAKLRRGVLQFVRQNLPTAAADLEAVANSSDPFLRYVAQLMLGTIAERTGRTDLALLHYRAAHDAVPASASSVVLASMLYRTGRTDEAAAVLQRFESGTPPPDPWRLYGQRDYRWFGQYRDAMRRLVAS